MTDWNTLHGDVWALDRQVLRTVVGSVAHGLQLGTDDNDEMGVYVPTAEHLLGLGQIHESLTARTARDAQTRSTSADTDLVLYSLRKYARLVVVGNPTVLVPLFVSDEHVLHQTDVGRHLRVVAPRWISRTAGDRFLGYLQSQRGRIESGRKLPNRPELVSAHGYDTKYAAHALRLAVQGAELWQTGRITLPMPEEQRQHVLEVRRGDVGLAEALRRIDHAADVLKALVHGSGGPLAETVDTDAVDRWLAHQHREAWAR